MPAEFGPDSVVERLLEAKTAVDAKDVLRIHRRLRLEEPIVAKLGGGGFGGENLMKHGSPL